MTKRSRKTQKTQVKPRELVMVSFTEEIDQAKEYEALLKANEIPVMIKEQDESQSDRTKGFAILVPEDFVDEAHVIIESENAYEDFYDISSDEDEEGFDSSFFEEEF